MNKYRVLLPLLVNGEFTQGDVFEQEFDSPGDEQTNIDSGLLEIVPRDYQVVGDSYVFETKPGDVFTKALTMGQEEHLIGAGHIVRCEEKATSTKKKEGAS